MTADPVTTAGPARSGRRTRAPRGESGASPVEFVAGVALLVLPVALLVLSFPVWVETQTAGRVAAREAARAFAVAPDDRTGREAAADVVAEVLANRGAEPVGPPRVEGTVEGPPGGTQDLVTVTVTVRLPALAPPFLRDVTGVDWEVGHTEPVDVYRSRP